MNGDEQDRLVGRVVRRHQAKRKELNWLKERAMELYDILVSVAYRRLYAQGRQTDGHLQGIRLAYCR